jgi:hypothetical protein
LVAAEMVPSGTDLSLGLSVVFGLSEVLPTDVELTELTEVVDKQMVEANRLLGLDEGVFVAMDLGEDRTKLHLKRRNDYQLAHAVRDWLILQTQLVRGQLLERLVDA